MFYYFLSKFSDYLVKDMEIFEERGFYGKRLQRKIKIFSNFDQNFQNHFCGNKTESKITPSYFDVLLKFIL